MSQKDWKADLGNQGTRKAGTATRIIQIWLYLAALYSQETIHTIKLILYKKQRLVFHLKVCQLLAISYYNGMTRYEVEHPFPPSPEEQCKGQQKLYPALDNNKSWIYWPHSMQAEKYLFIFLKSFSVALLYLVNSWTGRMIPRTISSTPISTPIASVLQATFREKK